MRNAFPRKQHECDPVDMILQAIRAAPHFNANAAWEEVKEERRRERV